MEAKKFLSLVYIMEDAGLILLQMSLLVNATQPIIRYLFENVARY